MSNPPKRQLSRKPLVREDINLHSLLEPNLETEKGEEGGQANPSPEEDRTNHTPETVNKVEESKESVTDSAHPTPKEAYTEGEAYTDKEHVTYNTNGTDEEYKEYNTYKNIDKSLSTSDKRYKNEVKNRKAKRKKEEVSRIKFTTTLQPKFIEMIEEVSLQERIRDKNEWIEKILTYYAKKVGYELK